MDGYEYDSETRCECEIILRGISGAGRDGGVGGREEPAVVNKMIARL